VKQVILFSSFLLFIFSCSVSKKQRPVPNKEAETLQKPVEKPFQSISEIKPPPVPKKDSLSTATISCVGDLMCHITQYTYAKKEDGTYDFNPTFSEVKLYLSESDFTIGNLETTFAGTSVAYSGYPNFNSPDSYVEALKNAGFDLLVTSNNHSMDMGEAGLLRTIEMIKKNNLSYTGTYTSQRDRDSIRIFSLNGIKLGVVNFTYGTNGQLPSAQNKFMLNIIDSAQFANDISLARKAGADVVLAFFHFGPEYAREPSEFQKNVVSKTIECGADIIVGAHPHVLQTVETYKTKNTKLDSGVVAWSLGNFISNQKDHYCDAGAIINLSITKNHTKDSIRISSVSFIPTWVYRGTNEKKKKHIIFPSEYYLKDSLPDFIDAELKSNMKLSFEESKAMMTKKSSKNVLKSVTGNKK